MPIRNWFAKKPNEEKKPNDKVLTTVITPTEAEPDDILPDVNEDFLSDIDKEEMKEIVEQMYLDEQVSSEMETLKAHITAQSYNIKISHGQEENSTAVEYKELYEKFVGQDGGKLLSQFYTTLSCLDYGYCIAEVVWKDPLATGGSYEIEKLNLLPHTRFKFNVQGKIVDTDTEEIIDVPYKYIKVSHDVRDNNYNGHALILRAFWPWVFKKACKQASILYVKKSIIPTMIALMKASNDGVESTANANRVATILSRVQNNTAVALANVESVEKFEATSKGSDIVDIIKMFDGMISKAIIGSSTLTNDSKYSNSGDSDHLVDLLGARSKRISQLTLQDPLNELLSMNLSLNSNQVKPEAIPSFEYSYAYDLTLKETLEIVNTNTIPVSEKWFRGKFSLPRPVDDEDSLLKETPTPGGFNQNVQDETFAKKKANL